MGAKSTRFKHNGVPVRKFEHDRIVRELQEGKKAIKHGHGNGVLQLQVQTPTEPVVSEKKAPVEKDEPTGLESLFE